MTFPIPMADLHVKNKAGSPALGIARGLEMMEIATCLEERAVERCRKRIKSGPLEIRE